MGRGRQNPHLLMLTSFSPIENMVEVCSICSFFLSVFVSYFLALCGGDVLSQFSSSSVLLQGDSN